MNKSGIIYATIILVILGAIIAIDAAKPKPLNWSPSYDVNDKIPLGLYVFNKELPQLFKGEEINKFNITPYEYFDSAYDYETYEYDIAGTYLAVADENELDFESVDELLTFASYGNTVFLSMNNFPLKILDTLGVEMEYNYYLSDTLEVYTDVEKEKKYQFVEGAGGTYFSKIDTLATTILGHHALGKYDYTNFISVPFERGRILLHTQPAAFTNFYLLKDDGYEYAETVLSYIPQGALHFNTGSHLNERISGSMLRYINSQRGLSAAFWLGFWTLIIFMLFNARRKQRIVPETEPLRNTTVDFAKTIGNLYYLEKDHHTIIDKQIIYLLEKIRNEYNIDTTQLDDAFVEKLALKTGKPEADVEKAIHLIQKHRSRLNSTDVDLVKLNKAIEKLGL